MAIQASLEAANLEGISQDASSSSRRVVSDHAERIDMDPLISPFESLTTTGSEAPSRYRQAVSQKSRNAQLEESSFPPLSTVPAGSQQKPQSESLLKNTMAARLRQQSNKTVNGIGSATSLGIASNTALPAINQHYAWPVVSSVSGSASSSGHSKPVHENVSAPAISHQNVWPTANSSFGSTSTSIQSKPSIASGPTSSYRNSSQARSAMVQESSSASFSTLRNWSGTNRINHSTSAPNLVESGSFDSSPSAFPSISLQIDKPASIQASVGVGDIRTANKSLVERIRLALDFDQDKYNAFKDISGEYRQGLIDAETYLAYVDQFGLLHLVFELARLCPDAQKQNELIETYNVNFGHKILEQNGRTEGSRLKDAEDNIPKKGKGKSIDAEDNKPKNKLADSFIHTVKDLQSSYKPSEDEVEVLFKDGYRASKGKSLGTTLEKELNSHSAALKPKAQNESSAGGGSSQIVGDGHSRNKQKKKTSKFLRVRLGDGSAEALENLSNPNPDPDPDLKEMESDGLPVRGVWRNGGGQKLLAMTSRGPKK